MTTSHLCHGSRPGPRHASRPRPRTLPPASCLVMSCFSLPFISLLLLITRVLLSSLPLIVLRAFVLHSPCLLSSMLVHCLFITFASPYLASLVNDFSSCPPFFLHNRIFVPLNFPCCDSFTLTVLMTKKEMDSSVAGKCKHNSKRENAKSKEKAQKKVTNFPLAFCGSLYMSHYGTC